MINKNLQSKKKHLLLRPQKKIPVFNLKEFEHYFWDFKPEVYKKKYSDLKNLSVIELKYHYFLIGRFQRRIYNNGIKILIVCDEINANNTNLASGGLTALYNLGKMINECKYKNIYAKMYTMSRKNTLNPYCNIFAYENEINPRTLVIYPDGTLNNPLNARHVMRWILLELGTSYRSLDTYKTWDPYNLVYHWEPSVISDNTKILNVTFVDSIFENKNFIRKNESCYLIKKRTFYTNSINYIHPTNSICIDNKCKENVVNIFNESVKFYCYDLNTFLSVAAIICGCKVIYYPDNKTKKEFVSKTLFNNFIKFENMVAWGENDIANINYNENDIKEMIEYIKSLSNTLNIFLEDIYNYFNGNYVNIPTVKSVYYLKN
jgi:hypothetical protein